MIIILLSWQLKSALERKGELTAKLETQASETLECTDANETSFTTITQLEKALEDITADRAADAASREAVLVERDRELSAARAENEVLRGEREDEADTNIDCADLRSLSVGLFCPVAGDQLRERSRGPGGNEDGGSESPGGGDQATP